jgi:hypothetical protein
MNAGGSAAIVLISAVLALATAAAAQDTGPILKPRPKPKSAAGSLVVMCDLACNWKLDGEAKGRVEAGDAAKASASLGEHVVVATTLDGLDRVQQVVEVSANGQKAVNNQLAPVRDARLSAAQTAKDEADQQQQREQAARKDAAGVWTDSTTGLMWTKKDNSRDVTWQYASDYCRNLFWARRSDWQLPTIGELDTIYDPGLNSRGSNHVKGGLDLTGWVWSSSTGESAGEMWAFSAGGGVRVSIPSRVGQINV